MILGLSVPAFTLLHVTISLIGIAAGFLFLGALLGGRWLGTVNLLFLVFTILTSVTGFFFHSKAFGPPHVVGIISLIDLAVALVALYGFHRAGTWRAVYTVTAVVALWLNVFVGIVQSFQKIGFLNAFAPTGTEPPFFIAQGVALLLFALAAFVAIRKPAGPA